MEMYRQDQAKTRNVILSIDTERCKEKDEERSTDRKWIGFRKEEKLLSGSIFVIVCVSPA